MNPPCNDTGPARSIDVSQLDALRAAGEFALFDVREAGQAHRGHLFGASFLPRRQIELRIGELVPDRATPIVVYDDGGADRRAARAADTLRALGYTRVAELAGGTAAWRAAGRPLTEGANVPSKLFGEQVHEHDEVPRVPPQQLLAWQSDGTAPLVCDIRSPEEYARSRIPGARGAFGTELALLAADLQGHAGPVVVHCSGRTRSIIACQTLREFGLTRVYALENGTMGWQLAGFELERGTPAGVMVPSDDSAHSGEARARELGLAAGAASIDADTLRQWLSERAAGHANVYPIDVRQVEAYVAGHVPGSIVVPGGLAIQRTDEFIAVRAARIVFIDEHEARAWLAAYWLRRMGFAQVYVLAGGLAGWAQDGGALESGRGRAPVGGLAAARSKVDYVDAQQLAAELAGADAPLVVNVDTSRNVERARIAGSRWLRYGDLEDLVQQMPDAERRRLVLSCHNGVLSTLAGANLARLGIVGVRVLQGGLVAWQRAGLPVASGWEAAFGAADDLVVQPYDGGRESMARYLAWEQALTAERRRAT